MAKRTDIHRKGAIIPGAYRHVLSYNGATTQDGWPVPSYGINCELDRRQYDKDGKLVKNGEHDPDGRCCVIGLLHVAKVKFAEHGSTGQCTACGAAFVYGEVWEHIETSEHIHVGHICGQKYGLMADRSEFELRAGRARQAAAVQLKKVMNAERRAAFLADHPGLEEALKAEHHIIRDIAARFVEWCSLSDKQVALVMKIARELATPKPEEQHVDAPIGRATFRGIVVSVRVEEGYYGSVTKMVVKVTEKGGTWLAWGTMPASLCWDKDGRWQEVRGAEVEITATLTRSDRDAHFAFAKRPRGKVLQLAVQPDDDSEGAQAATA